jgi:drug/metabolite transporter (DMT)-like permease
MATIESPDRISLNLGTTRSKRLKADLALFSVALIWGIAFVVQRIAAVQIGVFLFNGLRFLIGALVLLPFYGKGINNEPSSPGIRRKYIPGMLLVGLAVFAGSTLQQEGIRYTTAGNAGFITGLYVVFIPIFMAFFLRQRPRPVIWIAASLSVLGMFLLSAGGKMKLNPGDGLVLVGAFFWALHVILVGRMVHRVGVVRLAIVQYLVCGLLSMSIGLITEELTFSVLVHAWWLIAFAGVISVGLGYTLQAIGQRVAPPADAAIILSMEAVFAALFGWWILDEYLTLLQLAGCGIILCGNLLAQSGLFTRSRRIRNSSG